MIIHSQTILQTATELALALLILSMALTFFRLVRGPKAADRVVALDLISVLIVAFLAAYAVHTGNTSYLDVAIAYALVAFLGTVAMSRFLLRSGSAHPGTNGKGEKK